MLGAGRTRSRGGLQVFTLGFLIKDWRFQATDNKLDSAISSLSLVFPSLGPGRLERPNQPDMLCCPMALTFAVRFF